MRRSREIRLAHRPHGLPDLDAFSMASREIGAPAAGEVLVRNRWLSIDPALRGRMYAADSYIPPFAIGDPIAGAAVGEVVESGDARFGAGDLVLGESNWSDFALLSAESVQKLPDLALPPQAHLGIAGITGLTAYAGLTRVAEVKRGDTVFVSAGAGAVGSTACLIAKQLGCRVIASAGGADKERYLRAELGVETVIDYTAVPHLRKALVAAAPEGIDVFFDNVGGAFLEAAIACANDHARFVICGMISAYNATEPVAGPRNLALLPVKRIGMQGFIVFDHLDLMPEYHRQLSDWHKRGALCWRETVREGLDAAPQAFIDLFAGGNIGKMLVQLP